MRALSTRLRKIELLRNVNKEEHEVRFIYITLVSSDNDGERNVIGIKSKNAFHKRENDESMSQLKERITLLYKGGGNAHMMMYVYEDKK